MLPLPFLSLHSHLSRDQPFLAGASRSSPQAALPASPRGKGFRSLGEAVGTGSPQGSIFLLAHPLSGTHRTVYTGPKSKHLVPVAS